MNGEAQRVILPMVVATGGVLIGGSVGGPKTNRSNFGVLLGSFISIFFLLLLNESAPRLSQGIALVAAVSSALVYGPSVAKAINSIK